MWADSLVEWEAPWDTTGSATHFFDLMSYGNYTLRGTVYPHVVVLDTTIADYVDKWGDPSSYRPVEEANRDVIRKVAADMDSLLLNYDSDDDGFLDFVYVYYWSGQSTIPNPNGGGYGINRAKSDNEFLFTGVAFAAPLDTLTFETQGASKPSIQFDASGVACQVPSGRHNGQVRTRIDAVGVLAHEFGHLLRLNHYGELSSYDIMRIAGVHPAYFSAATLEKLGWITPTTIDASTGDTTVVLPAVPDPGAYLRVNGQIPNQNFLLELRNRDLSYATDTGPNPCKNKARGHTGLLILQQRRLNEYTVEVATGRFGLAGDPDPVSGTHEIEQFPRGSRDKDSDLFEEGHVNVFGPYTNPSTDLYDLNAPVWPLPQDIYSGITFYDIEWANPGSDDSIRVSIHFDTLADSTADADTIRIDTKWDGLVQLTGDVVVDSTSTLTVTENTDVSVGAQVDANAGGADSSLVELIVARVLEVDGDSANPALFGSARDSTLGRYIPSLSIPFLDLDDVWLLPDSSTSGAPPPPLTPAAEGDWYGIRLLDAQDTTALSSIQNADFRYAHRAISPDWLSGDIVANKFSNSEVADIYLEGDTVVQEGHEWRLDAPTRVVASNVPRIRHITSPGLEDVTRVELLVLGELRTSSDTTGQWVEFTPEVPDPARGEAWHGVNIVGTGTAGDGRGVGRIRNALFDSARADGHHGLRFGRADRGQRAGAGIDDGGRS